MPNDWSIRARRRILIRSKSKAPNLTRRRKNPRGMKEEPE